jgi:hypothetical protein
MTLPYDSTASQKVPTDDDVLVSRVGATGRYSVAVLPELPHLQRERRSRALEAATLLALDRGVDAWLTEDLIHFVCVARFRAEGRQGSVRHAAALTPDA